MERGGDCDMREVTQMASHALLRLTVWRGGGGCN